MATESDKETGDKWGIRICISLAILFVILGFVAAFIGYKTPRSDDNFLNDLGNFGSYLQGTTASFWSLAGLLIIFVAFLAQKEQLKQQQAELARQEQQFRSQQESIKRQNFESAFFQLLSLHNQNVIQLRGTVDGIEVEGRACFEKWFNQIFRKDFDSWIKRNPGRDAKVVETASDYYLSFHKTNRANFSHYFRTLYHVFKFVKFGDIPDGEKKRYASLARAQLSANELAFLFYNGISPHGVQFKPLIEEFGLMEHLEDKLLDPSHGNFYDPKAFK